MLQGVSFCQKKIRVLFSITTQPQWRNKDCAKDEWFIIRAPLFYDTSVRICWWRNKPYIYILDGLIFIRIKRPFQVLSKKRHYKLLWQHTSHFELQIVYLLSYNLRKTHIPKNNSKTLIWVDISECAMHTSFIRQPMITHIRIAQCIYLHNSAEWAVRSVI